MTAMKKTSSPPDLVSLEQAIRHRHPEYAVFCGVDEAGRGPLAGDVYAGAVILPPDFDISGLNDSKKLTEKKREALFERISAETDWAYGVATPAEIDELNILNAALLAMRRAVEGLKHKPDYLMVDGSVYRDFRRPGECVVGGDARVASIAAASVVAKVLRDRYMKTLAEQYPQYMFEKHKGYPTPLHYEMLDAYGPSPVHRMSFLKKYYAERAAVPADVSGRYGEDTAARWLEAQGYRILARNWRAFVSGRMVGEVDIVAEEKGALVFIEVKQRRSARFSSAIDAIDPHKKQCLALAAEVWLREKGLDVPVRVDCVEVYTGTPQDSPFGVTYPPPVLRLSRGILE